MKTEDLIEEIERNRRMSEFEATPRTAHDYCSAMPDKEMINRYIEYLINQSESKDLQNRSLQLKIDGLTEKIASLLEEKQKEGNRMEDVLSELKELRKELAKSHSEASGYRKKISKLEEQLKAAKADKYGRRRSKSKDENNDADISSSDRSESEENFDGNEYKSDVEAVSDSKESGNSSATGQTFNVQTGRRSTKAWA